MSSSDPTDDPTVTPKTPGFRYRLRVTTGSDWGAGTMAAITVTLIGTEGQSEPYNLIWPMYHLKAGSPGSRVTTSRSRCCCCIDGRRRRNGRRCTSINQWAPYAPSWPWRLQAVPPSLSPWPSPPNVAELPHGAAFPAQHRLCMAARVAAAQTRIRLHGLCGSQLIPYNPITPHITPYMTPYNPI
ncbi:uncharacterized protein LOC107307542 isoform X2 [Coturnix japonica]|uniref:uncharacterized protein LOC107307542 isoform X2 n=1 Tax=Coturnix japonica TaxID=93934 RepID=UPI000776DBF8|nr:uncharacterized protein LOC107307542 isoform X2 [Coturnix japonica]